ncbi:glycoside hydrolase superfamily [Dichotomopilus funicola]|uniref:chitinase n=1 Tax=Dichotomopilus funicola TaxID=1934379 RepID=A0AAN6V2B5_9PEZI|nr:glycoside hydrolase superfamily [Dichotomopilus funicola]
MLRRQASLLLWSLLLLLVNPILAQDSNPDYTCSPTKGCTLGICGMGPTFCAPGNCTSQCDAKSDCDPGWGPEWSQATNCPLNVCCSKFGFCGTTADFCDGKTVPSPQCPGGKSADQRTIGYYEGWNLGRSCGRMAPEDIPLGYYTHINYAFALVNPTTFHIEDMGPDTAALYDRVSALKSKDPDLKVWIAVGGWAMNDPGPYRTTFSDLAASTSAQDAFFESLITFMRRHNFDGVDLDWEYPVAEDRGGVQADFDNYATLVRRLRERLNQSGRDYGLTITLPASYWYLRGFNLQDIEPHLDWFNIMTYDIHGTWDSTVKAIGPYAFAHTNMTEIQQALELLWRNNINPGRVVLGLGFYGRSFTMKSPDCLHAGCEFTDGARGGECTGTPGVLSAAEINTIIAAGGTTVTLDEEAAVQIVTWDSNQWVSYDDAGTLKRKLDYANLRCLGGTMIWAIDLDDGTLINALGSDLSRPKSVLGQRPPSIPDFETHWDEL